MALVTSISDTEPQTFAQAVDQQVWREAMLEEYDSIMRNDVWEVVLRPVGKSVVTLGGCTKPSMLHMAT
jgi:hypothetical protein